MIALSLVFDGVAAAQEDIIAHDYHVSNIYMMFFANLFAIPIFLVLSLASGDLQQTLHFMANDTRFLGGICLYVICSVSGQYFIYQMIKLANTILLTAVTNTRKIVTVVLSVLIFKHKITRIQIVGIIIVFGSLFVDIMTRKPHDHNKHK